MTSIRSLSEVIETYCHSMQGDKITVSSILEAFHERGLGMALILFATPMALPIPVPPGINVALATPLLFLTLQQALGAHTVWLPDHVQKKTFAREALQATLLKIVPFLKRIEILLKPRLPWVTTRLSSQIMGFLGFVMALTICIPVPLTNTVPSFGITIMALGLMMRDGLAVLTGAAIGTAWVLMLVTAV